MAAKRKAKKTALQLRCEECRKHIPKSVANTAEGGEYIKFFCGLECYEQWFNEKRAQTSKLDRRKKQRRVTTKVRRAKPRVGSRDRRKVIKDKALDRRKKPRR